MNKFINYIAIILLGSAVCNSAIAATDQLTPKIQKDMEWALDHYKLAGISVSYKLGNDSDIKTLSAGYSNVKTKRPITSNTYFGVGSITKVFISTLIMQQVALGKISLDETLAAIAKQYPGKNKELSNIVKQYPHLGIITLRQYLTHTSGIPEAMGSDEFLAAFNKNPMIYFSNKNLIAMAMKKKPYFQPGEKDYYGYTNTDYEIAGIVIGAVTGKSVADNIKQLTSSLGLNNIYFPNPHSSDIPAPIKNNIAQGYITKNDPTFNFKAFSTSREVTFGSGILAKNITSIAINSVSVGPASGGIITKTPVLVKWYWLLFHEKVISQAALNNMLNGVTTADPNKKYGLAIVTEQTKQYGVIYSHDGNTLGYRANLVYVPSLHLVLCIATNSDTNAFDENTKELTGKLLATFKDKQ